MQESGVRWTDAQLVGLENIEIAGFAGKRRASPL
jgi:hypothetical protein